MAQRTEAIYQGIITPVGIVSCGIIAAILAGLGVFIEIKRQQI